MNVQEVTAEIARAIAQVMHPGNGLRKVEGLGWKVYRVGEIIRADFDPRARP